MFETTNQVRVAPWLMKPTKVSKCPKWSHEIHQVVLLGGGAPWRSHASEFLDQSMTIPIQPNRKVDPLSLTDLILTREGRVQTCTYGLCRTGGVTHHRQAKNLCKDQYYKLKIGGITHSQNILAYDNNRDIIIIVITNYLSYQRDIIYYDFIINYMIVLWLFIGYYILWLIGGLEHVFYSFHSVGNNHPNWLSYFQRGWNHPPDGYIMIILWLYFEYAMMILWYMLILMICIKYRNWSNNYDYIFSYIITAPLQPYWNCG